MLRDVLEQFHHRQGVGTNGFMGQQQDAHEFFVWLLDGLHEEIAKWVECPPSLPPSLPTALSLFVIICSLAGTANLRT